ncbi:RluA family pseudouridine synthase [bacterium]|nr:MAG: RluA family pseudouridine synthase [bacterium]
MASGSGYRIVYEDSAIIVADKSSGLLTVATPKKEKFTLESLLSAYPAHRLDRETSGLILFAKTRRIQKILMDEFRKKQVKKLYRCFVHGIPGRKRGAISRYVRDNPYEPAKYALTKYRVLESRGDFSVVEVEPITGRTNQIRLHFKQIGHPLVGERRFAFARDFNLKFRRAALHSSDLGFSHPLTRKPMSFHLDLPRDMREFLESH